MNTISISDVFEIVHRTANNLSETRKDHGIRVAYLVYRALLHSTTPGSEELRAILRTAFFHEIGAHEPQNNAVLAYLLSSKYAPYPQYAPILLNHRANKPCFAFLHCSHHYLAEVFSIADQLDELLQSGVWNGYDLYFHFDSLRGTLYSEAAVDVFFKNGIHLQADEFQNDGAFLALLFGEEAESAVAESYLSALVAAMDFQSEKTAARRAVRMAFCSYLMTLLPLDSDGAADLMKAAMICDIGAYGMPPTLHEYGNRARVREDDLLHTHVEAAERILAGVVPDPVLHLISCHHEHPNGTGYPKGLTADQMSPEAHLLALADDMSQLYCGTAADPKRALRISVPKRSAFGSADADLAMRVTPHIGEMIARAELLSEQVLEQYRDLSVSMIALQTKIERYHAQAKVALPLISEKNPVAVRPRGQAELLAEQMNRRRKPVYHRTVHIH